MRQSERLQQVAVSFEEIRVVCEKVVNGFLGNRVIGELSFPLRAHRVMHP
jgi:hypothetical protein